MRSSAEIPSFQLERERLDEILHIFAETNGFSMGKFKMLPPGLREQNDERTRKCWKMLENFEKSVKKSFFEVKYGIP